MTIQNLLPAAVRPWYQAARPRTLTATYAPVLLAGVVTIANGVFNLPRFALALIGALLLQIASNLINEYVDYQRGTDAKKSDGMGMVLSRAQLSPQQVLIGAIASVAGGVLIGLLLVVYSGPLLLVIGGIGVLVVIAYTAGPVPLSYIGLGEAAVFVAMGPLMTLGTYYAVSSQATWQAFLIGLPIAFPIAAILHANNMRDMDSDRLANKRTLAVRFGVEGARREYTFLIYGAYVAAIILIIVGVMPITVLIAAVTLPEAINLVKLATSTTDSAVLHRMQGMTAQFNFRFGLALTAGWLLFVLLRGH